MHGPDVELTDSEASDYVPGQKGAGGAGDAGEYSGEHDDAEEQSGRSRLSGTQSGEGTHSEHVAIFSTRKLGRKNPQPP